MDWLIVLKKAGWGLLLGLAGVAGAAVGGYLMDAQLIRDLLLHAGLPDLVTVALVPAFVALGKAVLNWIKHLPPPQP